MEFKEILKKIGDQPTGSDRRPALDNLALFYGIESNYDRLWSIYELVTSDTPVGLMADTYGVTTRAVYKWRYGEIMPPLMALKLMEYVNGAK